MRHWFLFVGFVNAMLGVFWGSLPGEARMRLVGMGCFWAILAVYYAVTEEH